MTVNHLVTERPVMIKKKKKKLRITVFVSITSLLHVGSMYFKIWPKIIIHEDLTSSITLIYYYYFLYIFESYKIVHKDTNIYIFKVIYSLPSVFLEEKVLSKQRRYFKYLKKNCEVRTKKHV